MRDITQALEDLRYGRFVLLHDSESRENETDMVVGAKYASPGQVSQMRRDAGGLICVAVCGDISDKLGLPFMSDILKESKEKFPLLNRIDSENLKYDKRSSFSLSVNHRDTYTGINDTDRALTINELARLGEASARLTAEEAKKEFGVNFMSPGHVHILLSSGLENRTGHTELSIALMKMARITPVAAICEMLDSGTHTALSVKDSMDYAKTNGIQYLEASDVIEAYKKWQGSV